MEARSKHRALYFLTEIGLRWAVASTICTKPNHSTSNMSEPAGLPHYVPYCVRPYLDIMAAPFHEGLHAAGWQDQGMRCHPAGTRLIGTWQVGTQ
eukprot:scaffold126873_cov19-Tisochrysis_lutea.AAC.1